MCTIVKKLNFLALLQCHLSFLSSTHSLLPLSLTLLSCLSPSASLMLSASRSHSLWQRRWRWNPKILAAKILGLTLSSHSLCRRRWRRNPKILAAKILGLTLSCSHVLLPFFLYLISEFGDLDSLCLTCGFGDLDFVVKIWCSLNVLVLDFDFKCIWFPWIVWFQMYLVFVNRKFEWVWWIWFEIHLDLLFVLHCCCDSFFSGKQIFFLIDWASKIFFLVGPQIGPNPLTGPGGGGSGKKTRLVNGPGSGHGSWPAGWVRVWKNPARTRPVAIPI